MRILLTLPRPLFPADTGGKIRSLNIFQRLAKRAEIHAVSFADPAQDAPAILRMRETFESYTPVFWREANRRSMAFYRDVLANQFSSLPYFLAKFNQARFRARIEELTGRKRFDLLFCDFLQSAAPLATFDFRPKLLFQHNVESLLRKRKCEVEQRPLHKLVLRREWKKTETIETTVCRSFDHVLTVSQEDQATLRQAFGVDRTSILPTGVDTDYFQPTEHSEIPGRLVFVGSMDWDPNEDGILWFLKKIYPQIRSEVPNVTLAIVGRNPSPALRTIGARTTGVEITGWVADVRPHLTKAEVVIVPLRVGGGTRIKIPEAMAMAKAVVSTRIGAEGLQFRSGRDICLADDPNDFVQTVIGLLRDASIRTRIGLRAREEVVRNCSWESVVDTLEQTLERLTLHTEQPAVIH